jgi:TM2 domain-containing membrane protein YozV
MKNKNTALLLAFFIGTLGVHQFYLGKKGKGLFYLFTFGLCGLLPLIDCVNLLLMSQNDFDNKYNNQNIQREILNTLKK